LPFLRFGGVVGVRRAYRFAQFIEAHARSPPLYRLSPISV
jgi:hypothetical protein